MTLLSHSIELSFLHRVYFTRDAGNEDNPVLEQAVGDSARVLLVLDERVAAAHPGYAGALANRLGSRMAAPPMILPGGEPCKQDDSLYATMLAALDAAHIDRHSALIAVGGGAFLDATGYAAATAHRGVRSVRMPSTTLSQADSGVGVKNGLNMFGKKNYAGTFHVPYAVVNDFSLLHTQARENLCGGLVEAVKVALLKDAGFFSWLEDHLDALRCGDAAAIERAVMRSAELHFQHICQGGDPFERGSSRPLDFGHWAGHKLESLTGHQLGHAQAVAIGLALDLAYACHAGWLDTAVRDRSYALLRGLGLPLAHPLLSGYNADGTLMVAAGLEEFREHLGGRLTLITLDGIARPREIHEIDGGMLAAAARTVMALGSQSG